MITPIQGWSQVAPSSTGGRPNPRGYLPLKCYRRQVPFNNSNNRLNPYLVVNFITTHRLPCFIAILLRVAKPYITLRKMVVLSSSRMAWYRQFSNSLIRKDSPLPRIKGWKARSKNMINLIRSRTFITRLRVELIPFPRDRLAAAKEEWNLLISLN
jgi:hypothetical protein